MSNPLRLRVINLYRTLYHMGKEYPQGSAWFHERLKRVFKNNRDVTDTAKIEQLCAHGEFVVKELEAMYSLRRYRAMKQRYYDVEEDEETKKKLKLALDKIAAEKTPVKSV